MTRQMLGFILIVAGVALLLFARGRVAKAVRSEDEPGFDAEAREAARFLPQLAILFGGLAIIAGFLLLAQRQPA